MASKLIYCQEQSFVHLMRKRLKMKKGRGCALCKPWKYGKMKRWKSKEESTIKLFEEERRKNYAI